MSQHIQQDGQEEQTLVSHLVELRQRLIWAILIIAAIFLGLFYFANDLYVALSEPLTSLLPKGTSMIATDVTSPFFAPFKLTMVASIFLAMPFILHQAWSLIMGAALMFSSTIIGIKLLPTTVLHHRRTGELVVGLLLLQDVIAIIVLLILYSAQSEAMSLMAYIKPILSLPLLTAGAFALVRWVILPLITRFDRFHEYIFLLALGWCLGLAETAQFIGLSAEMGAFVAGVTLASSPISQFIATNLKP
jgi:Sec-independent protein secretion pathway component TatC